MRKSLLLIGTVLLSALVASADDSGKYEVFAGYSFVRFNPNSACSASVCGPSVFPSFNANGGDGQFVYNTEKGIGVAFDLGAVTKGEFNHEAIDTTVLNFVVGPRYTYRRHDSRFQPFVQALFGGAYSTSSTHLDILGGTIVTPFLFPPITINPNLPITTRLVESRTGFAMLAGGGLDIKVNKHMTFRPIGADYYLTRLPDFLTQNLPGHHHRNANNFRYTAGVNFVFGNEK
jgi:hypothetical protein